MDRDEFEVHKDVKRKRGQYPALSYDPYGPARAFIAKLLRKSPYEGRARWREQGRKKPSGPARIAYGPAIASRAALREMRTNFVAI